MTEAYVDCNGFRLHTGGALTQTDTIVNLDRGSLHVDGNYQILGSSILQMICYEDRVYVGGSFATASSMNHASMLRSGRMEVIATAFLALYGISAAFLPTNGVVFAVQLFSVAMAVMSVRC